MDKELNYPSPAAPTASEPETIIAKCWPCKRETSQRWAIDENYLVCPQCGKLISVKDAIRFNGK